MLRGTMFNGRPSLVLDMEAPGAARACEAVARIRREASGPGDEDQRERVEAAIRAVEGLLDLDWREGGRACVVLARQKLLRLRDLAPARAGRPAERETPRCERGCYVD